MQKDGNQPDTILCKDVLHCLEEAELLGDDRLALIAHRADSLRGLDDPDRVADEGGRGPCIRN